MPRTSIEHRPNWDEYFMQLANVVATRATCLRRGVGAVIVKDRRILATGYNGVPSTIAHCAETGCLRQQLGVPSGQRHEICRGLHAEQNAIIQAARHGINIDGATIYVNTQPCVVCAKMLINSGIVEIVYQNPYPDELAMTMLEEAGMSLRTFDFDADAADEANVNITGDTGTGADVENGVSTSADDASEDDGVSSEAAHVVEDVQDSSDAGDA